MDVFWLWEDQERTHPGTGAGNSANHCTNMSPYHKWTIMHNSQTHHFAIDKPLFIIQLQFIPLWCAGRWYLFILFAHTTGQIKVITYSITMDETRTAFGSTSHVNINNMVKIKPLSLQVLHIIEFKQTANKQKTKEVFVITIMQYALFHLSLKTFINFSLIVKTAYIPYITAEVYSCNNI